METKVLKLSLTEQAKDYLKQLVSIGVYGKTPTEVAYGLVMRSLQDLPKDGTLNRLGSGRLGSGREQLP